MDRSHRLLASFVGAFWWSSAAFGASCSYPNFSIGFEISAQDGPDASGRFLFAVSPLRCDASGRVIYDSGTGFSDGYEMGWYTQAEIRDALKTSFLRNLKTFEGWCRLHYVGINSRYRGTVDGISADAYPLQATPYLRVFENELHLPLGQRPRINRRDAIANQASNICSPPRQSKGPQCTVANPIAPGQGCKVQREIDYRAAGESALEFIRWYDSKSPYHALSALPRPLGSRWRHNHEVSLNAALGPSLVVMQRADGLILHFRPRPGHPGDWTGDADIVGRLSSSGDGWIYRDVDDAQETFDRSGKRLTRTLPDGQSLRFSYDAADRLSEVKDTFGRTLHLSYDASGRLSALTDPAGQVYQYGYDSEGKLGSVTFPDQSERRYSYTSTSVSHPLLPGVTRTDTYDSNGNVTTRTDFNGNLITATYDLARNLETRRVEAAGKAEQRIVTTQWHPVWRQPAKVAEPGRLSTWVYHGDNDGGAVVRCAPDDAVISLGGASQPIGVVCRKTEQATSDGNGSSGLNAAPMGLPRTWNFTYSSRGQLLSVDGPRSDLADVTTYTYHDPADPDPGKRGNLATITNPLGQTTQIMTYDGHGNPLTLIDANGTATSLAYDARQRLTSRSVDGESTTYAYDSVGQLLRITLPDGSSTHYTYDAAHRLTAVNDSLGNQVRYTLDALGNRTREDVLDPPSQLAQTRQRIYDALGRLAQDIGARGQITAYAYDANGNRSRFTDPLNHQTAFAYDVLDRLIQVTDPGLGQTRYAYDGQDRLIEVNDPRRLATRYTLDGLGNRLQQQSPDSGLTSSTHDAAGNEITRTDAKGQRSTFDYDALNRPIRISDHDGNETRYRWDQGANGNGRLTQIDDYQRGVLTGSLQTAYDPQGRIVSQTRRVGNAVHTFGYLWRAGQLAGLISPSGRRVAYTRDAAGQITEIGLTDLDGGSRLIASQISYHPFGGIRSYLDGAGQWHRRSYGQDGRVGSYTLGSQTWLITYDAAGRLNAQFDASDAARSVTYGYDAQDRLISAGLPSTSYGYTWDATGNRLSHTLGGHTRPYTIDPSSNRLQRVGSSPPRTYSHDANGSITSDGSNTYAYNGRGRLSQATTAAGVTRYQYNALGERVRKTGVTDTIYHYDPMGRLLAESAADGRIEREYLWLEDTPVAVLQ